MVVMVAGLSLESTRKVNLLSVDPGARHTAWAVWELHSDPLTDGHRWKCREAHESLPEPFLDQAKVWIEAHEFDRVAVEEFALQADKALQQTGSTFGTVEVIGTLRSLCRWNDVPFETIRPLVRDAAFTKMKAVKYRFPRDPAGHMKAAICVGAIATGWRGINHTTGDGVG